jgi:DNA-binding LacI/PurR family transcriptional regulator
MASVIDAIARELNISTASVSRALNDRPGVSADLRAKVLAKAQELNYSVISGARGLATSQTFALGFFIREKPDLSTYTDPFYGEILHGVEQALAQSDYHLTIASLSDEMLANPGSFRFVRERRIDGMILAGPDIPSDFILSMIQTEMPVVLVDNQLEYSEAHSISSDDEPGGYLAARHLIALGHTRIGAIAGPLSWSSSRRRVEGYRRAMHEAGLPLAVIHTDRTTIESGERAFHQLVRELPAVTGLCAVNDSMALGAIRAARSLGRQVPNDLSVIGFDDITWAALNDPPLTTMQIPKRQIGIEAAYRLLLLLRTPGLAPTRLGLAVQLVDRATAQRRSNRADTESAV